MPAYNKRPYAKSTRVTVRGVIKRPYRSSGGYGRSTPMQVVTSGLAPLRTGGFFGTRRTMQEKKVIDVDATTTNVSTTPSLTLLNGVAVGTDFTDRIGRKVIMKSCFFRAFLYPVDDTTQNDILRCIIVYDNQTNGAAPIITDIFKQSSPLSQLNLNNRDRFKILYDKEFPIGKVDTTTDAAFSNGKNVYVFKKYLKLNHEVIFGGTAATVASIQTGSIYLMFVTANTAAASANVLWTNRIRFVDA